MKNFTLAFAAFLLHAVSSYSQPGTLDSTFGINGKKKIHFGQANSLAILPDGKFLVAGSYSIYLALVRIKPNGRGSDKTFGGNGIAATYFEGHNDNKGCSIAIQKDGKIVVAGYSRISLDNSTSDFALVRYLHKGKPDSSFGVNGKMTTDFGGGDIGYSVALQTDGKIVVAGCTDFNGNNDFALARYKNNGTLDSTFGVNGKVTTDFGGSDVGRSVAILADGKIVVAGSFNHNFLVARYMPDGTIDSSFGVHGRTITNFGGSDIAYSLAIQLDKKIIMVGTNKYDFGRHTVLARYKQNGKPDTSFGVNGQVIATDFQRSTYGKSVAIQPDGKIVMAGYAGRESKSTDFALARYQQDGKPDNIFGVNGKVTTNLAGHDLAQSVAIQPDGKIVVVDIQEEIC